MEERQEMTLKLKGKTKMQIENTKQESEKSKSGKPVFKKRYRIQRKVSKPKRLSKSLGSLRELADAHRWVAMVTFKPEGTTDETKSNAYQRFLTGLLRRELRGTGIGFMLVREFGTGSGGNDLGDRSHFHVIVTDKLTETKKIRLKMAFLKRCGLPNNQSRAFDYTLHTGGCESRFGNYVSKLKKNGIDVKHAPEGWNYKKLIRLYHSGFLNDSSLVNNIFLKAS